jgi:hypothetical protein
MTAAEAARDVVEVFGRRYHADADRQLVCCAKGGEGEAQCNDKGWCAHPGSRQQSGGRVETA